MPLDPATLKSRARVYLADHLAQQRDPLPAWALRHAMREAIRGARASLWREERRAALTPREREVEDAIERLDYAPRRSEFDRIEYRDRMAALTSEAARLERARIRATLAAAPTRTPAGEVEAVRAELREVA